VTRPADPLDDLTRCAELIDQAVTLLTHGCSVGETAPILAGLAERVRQDVRLTRAGERVPPWS
jgi:hypothetical protein